MTLISHGQSENDCSCLTFSNYATFAPPTCPVFLPRVCGSIPETTQPVFTDVRQFWVIFQVELRIYTPLKPQRKPNGGIVVGTLPSFGLSTFQITAFVVLIRLQHGM